LARIFTGIITGIIIGKMARTGAGVITGPCPGICTDRNNLKKSCTNV
jgi:hypothetical protein